MLCGEAARGAPSLVCLRAYAAQAPDVNEPTPGDPSPQLSGHPGLPVFPGEAPGVTEPG